MDNDKQTGKTMSLLTKVKRDREKNSKRGAALTFSVSRKIGVGLFVLAGVVGASRVASGIHSPLDIVAGLLIGVISAVVSLGLVSLLYREKRVLQEGEKSTT